MKHKTLQDFKSPTHKEALLDSIRVPGNPKIILVPIGSWILVNEELIKKFAHWRAASSSMYYSQFPESTESMRNYLTTHSVRNSSYLLFMIEGKDSEPLGHMGIKSLRSDYAEVDSVMKSPRQTARGLMDRCLTSLIDFAKNDLGVKELRLEVVSKNNRAIDLYLRNDFIETHRFPLQRVQIGESISHRKVNSEDANVDFFALTMSRKLDSES